MSATETTAAANGHNPEPEVQSTSLEGHRIYVGNLSYSSTEEDVREFLAKSGGEILHVILPKKFSGRKPGGFAFVHFKEEADAKKAVAELNDTSLGDRKIMLEEARSKEDQALRKQDMVEKRNASRAAREAKAAETGGDNAPAAEKPKRKSRKPTSRRRQPGEEGEDEAAEGNGAVSDAGQKEGDGTASDPTKKAKKPRKPRSARIDAADGEVEGQEAKEPKERQPRERKPKLQLTGEQSESTIFVANLPFDVDDDALAAIFTNLSIRVKSATVIKGLRKNRTGRPFRASRGFGFVEVEDAGQQKEAVEKVEGSLIGDRKISAKIANEMKPIEVEETAAAASEGTKEAPIVAA